MHKPAFVCEVGCNWCRHPFPGCVRKMLNCLVSGWYTAFGFASIRGATLDRMKDFSELWAGDVKLNWWWENGSSCDSRAGGCLTAEGEAELSSQYVSLRREGTVISSLCTAACACACARTHIHTAFNGNFEYAPLSNKHHFLIAMCQAAFETYLTVCLTCILIWKASFWRPIFVYIYTCDSVPCGRRDCLIPWARSSQQLQMSRTELIASRGAASVLNHWSSL